MPELAYRFRQACPESKSDTKLLLLVSAVILGLILNALQAVPFRFLEGYALWPGRAYDRGCDIQRTRNQRIATPEPRLPDIQLGVLQEQLSRCPDNETQIGPARLGNALPPTNGQPPYGRWSTWAVSRSPWPDPSGKPGRRAAMRQMVTPTARAWERLHPRLTSRAPG